MKTMTVQENLKDCLLKYPQIFPNKWAVYHHWFIVNGCGYDWKNGELVESGEDALLTTVEEGIDYYFKETLSKIKKGESGFAFEINYLKKAIFDCINLEQRMIDFDSQRETIYPLCQYANIMNIPDNITPEWKAAVTEMYNWLLENYNNLTENNRKYVDQIKL